MAYRFISGSTANPMCQLGWKSLGVLELTALPRIKAEYWIAAVQEADALLVFGGDVWYLCRWMPSSGLELKSTRYCKYATANGNKPADAAYQIDRGTLRAGDQVKDALRTSTMHSITIPLDILG